MNRLGKVSLLGMVLFALLAYFLPFAYRLFSDLPVLSFSILTEKGRALLPIFRMSVFQAVSSVVLCFSFATLLGSLLYRYNTPFLLILFRGSFFLPSLLVIHLTLFWMGTSPYRYSFFSVLFAHFILNGFWLTVDTIEAFRNLPRKDMEMARTLGARRSHLFLKWALPFYLGRLRNSLLIIFSLCFSSFTIVMILGGGPPVQSLETEMYEGLRLGVGSTSDLLPLFFLQALIGITCSILTRSRMQSMFRRELPIFSSSSGVGKALSIFLSLLFVAFLLGPFLFRGEASASFLHTFKKLLENDEFRASVGLSLRIGLGTSFFVSLLCLCFIVSASTARSTAGLASFLGGLSPFLISASFLSLYRLLDQDDPTSSFWALVCLSTLTQFSFQFRLLYSWRESEDFSAFQVARTLGAGPYQAFRDLLYPRWKWICFGLVTSVFFFGFTEASVSFLYGGAEVVPFSVWLARSESHYAFQDTEGAQLFLLVLWFGLVFIQALVIRNSRHERQAT